MKVRPAALIIQNKSLLALRYNYNGKDVYMIPGGNVDPGETLPQTLERELWEELGIEIEVQYFRGMGEIINWFNKEDVLHCVFSARITQGTPAINPTHCSAREICWIPQENITSKIFYPNIPDYLSEILKSNDDFGYIGSISQPEIR
jgi:8-oxo-dGTP diphosphatase